MLKISIPLIGENELGYYEFVNDDKSHYTRLLTSLLLVKEPINNFARVHSLPQEPPALPAPVLNGLPVLWFENTELTGRIFGPGSYLNQITPEELKFFDLSA